MKKILIFVGLISLFHSATLNCARAQGDSIKVYFVGNGHGEKYKIFFDGELKLSVATKGLFDYTFYIQKKQWKSSEQMLNFRILKKGRLKFSYRDLDLQPLFNDRKKFLVVRKNPRLKKKFTVDFYWSNYDPRSVAHIHSEDSD
jgi:hypothetical protein